MSYPGMRTNRSRRYKYEGCEHSSVRGITVRLLTPTEIDEFKAYVERLRNPSLRELPKFRRNVV